MRIAVLLVLLLSLPSPARAAMLTLYSPFDVVHNGHNGRSAPAQVAPKPPLVMGDALGGCGHGRSRDAITHHCRGPADLR